MTHLKGVTSRCTPGALILSLIPLMAAGDLLRAAPPRGAAEEPVSVEVTTLTEGQGARVTLGFSRKVEYTLEETGSRLRVSVSEAIDEASRVDRRIVSEVLRRIRFDRTRRGTDIVFYLGREFRNFSLSELEDPFRVVLFFQGTAEPAIPIAGADEMRPEAGAEGEGSSGRAETPEPSVIPTPPFPSRAPKIPGEVRTIVIDPGHGGMEEGAVGAKGVTEKGLVLDIARRLRERLSLAGYNVTLTRDGDQTLDLAARTAIANHAAADLFLSIHANASARDSARGAEAYFLAWGPAGTRGGSGRANGPAGPGSADRDIDVVLWDMAQSSYLGRSSRLADLIQEEFDDLAGTRSRGVKQAPFRVLVGAVMPAVLVEVGFLSNPDEERLLAGPEYRDRIAAALAAAIEQFRSESLIEAESARGSGSLRGGFDGGGQ